ncbi:IclR family transcriptional regulator [Novosphingobium sp. G106]|nr:IclR family transcriptional regulator [Novosphingobium sp. G106]
MTQGLSLSELTRRVKLPRSTVHRLLTTMEAMRYVEFHRNRHEWAIGLQAYTVGAAFAQSRDLGQLGRPIMRSLMSEVDHPINFVLPGLGGMYYVAQETAEGGSRPFIRTGARLPMHTTASGKVLMAHWQDDELERFLDRRFFEKSTARSIVAPAALRDELGTIRNRGYAIDDEEHADGLRCVAAIVFDRHGLPKAALSISDSVGRLSQSRIDEMGPTLVHTANQMSREIASQLGF